MLTKIQTHDADKTFILGSHSSGTVRHSLIAACTGPCYWQSNPGMHVSAVRGWMENTRSGWLIGTFGCTICVQAAIETSWCTHSLQREHFLLYPNGNCTGSYDIWPWAGAKSPNRIMRQVIVSPGVSKARTAQEERCAATMLDQGTGADRKKALYILLCSVAPG